MTTRVSLSPRDLSLMRLLGWTPATAALLLQASKTFDGGAFVDERRLRERLQALAAADIVRAWSTAIIGGGLKNYYKLTPLGWQMLNGTEVPSPPRSVFTEVPPSLFVHTFRLAEVVIVTLVACHLRQVMMERFHRENDLVFRVGGKQVQPDCFFRLMTHGRPFNIAFEIDNSTASINSNAPNSIRHKLTVYHAYQQQVLSQWLRGGKRWERPRFRVVFLTPSVDRAHHILALAGETNPIPRRRLVYAATFDAFVTNEEPLFSPFFLDHSGHWQSLIDLDPTAPCRKLAVRLDRPVVLPLGLC